MAHFCLLLDVNHFLLHYIQRENCKPEILHIFKTADKFRLHQAFTPDPTLELGNDFESIGNIVKAIKQLELSNANEPLSASTMPTLKHCLHPSEYDKTHTLLLCRSIEKQEDDIYKMGGAAQANHNFNSKPVFIEDHHLSRIENRKFRGHFTNVWQGVWSKSRHQKLDVAIKQLKTEHFKTNSILLDFIKTSHTSMRWSHDTLRKIHAFSLATMTMVMEFFPLGKYPY